MRRALNALFLNALWPFAERSKPSRAIYYLYTAGIISPKSEFDARGLCTRVQNSCDGTAHPRTSSCSMSGLRAAWSRLALAGPDHFSVAPRGGQV